MSSSPHAHYPRDALGRILDVGDSVAYVTRAGSQVFISKRTVEIVHEGGKVTLTPLRDGRRRITLGKNVVLLGAFPDWRNDVSTN